MDETLIRNSADSFLLKKDFLKMLPILKKEYVLILKKIDLCSAIAVRLTKYTGKSKEFVHPKHFLEKKPWFVKFLDKKDTVLDLGSGNGQNAIKCSKVANKVIGIEIDEALIKIAQNTTNQKKINNIKFTRGNLEQKLPIKTASINKIIFLDVLEHLINRKQILSEARRTLMPGGLIMVGVPNKDTSWKKMQRSVGICSYADPDHKIEFSETSIRKLLTGSKFEIIHFAYGKFDTPLRGFYDIIGGLYLPLYKKISKFRELKSQINPKEASGFEIVAKKQ